MANFNTGLTKQQIITALTKALDSMSEQEVQDAISTAVSGKQDTLTFDSTPTSGSSNPVTSGGVYTDQQRQDDAIAGKADKGTFDLTIAGSPLQASEYSYSCIVTGDIATVCIRIVLAAELAVNTSRNLFKIPSGYYAPVAVAGTGYADGKVRVFWINTSGDVKIRIDEAIPAGASINANFCYSFRSSNWTTVTPASLQSVSPALMQAGRIDAELMDNTDNDASETSGGEEMR